MHHVVFIWPVVTWTWNSISLCWAVPRSWKNKQFNEIAKTVCGEVEVDICGFSAQLHFPSSDTSADPTLGELFLPHPSGETPFGFLGDSVWSLNMLSFSHRINLCPRLDLLDTVSQMVKTCTRWNKPKQKPESGQSWSLCHASWRLSLILLHRPWQLLCPSPFWPWSSHPPLDPVSLQNLLTWARAGVCGSQLQNSDYV